MARPIIDFQSGWPHIEAAITKLEDALENGAEKRSDTPGKTKKSKLFPNTTYMDIYTYVCGLLGTV